MFAFVNYSNPHVMLLLPPAPSFRNFYLPCLISSPFLGVGPDCLVSTENIEFSACLDKVKFIFQKTLYSPSTLDMAYSDSGWPFAQA